MPTLIAFGMINTSAQEQNAGVLVGEINSGGWDANAKINQGHGPIFGFFNLVMMQFSANIDNLEVLDGVMFDQDFKPMASANI